MTEIEIERNTEALVALVRSRKGWNDHDIRAAIADATTVGVGWPTICRDLVRLMTIEDADPRDLVTPHQRRNTVADYRAHAAAAREALPQGEQ